jgi:hypothetical protein
MGLEATKQLGEREIPGGQSFVREFLWGDCNDKPGSLTVTARISRSLQTPRNLPLSNNRPTVLLAAKTYGSVFYDKLTPSIVRTKW